MSKYVQLSKYVKIVQKIIKIFFLLLQIIGLMMLESLVTGKWKFSQVVTRIGMETLVWKLDIAKNKRTNAERDHTDFQHHLANSPESCCRTFSCILTNFLQISRRAPMFSSSRRLQMAPANLRIFIRIGLEEVTEITRVSFV